MTQPSSGVLNVCISSTLNWNPGDDFIRLGVRRLLQSTLRTRVNYFIWNRNPDFFLNPWSDCRIKEEFLSNSCSSEDLRYMDLFVFAGTPEWFGQPTEPLYREILSRRVPALFLGLGDGKDLGTLSKTEKRVLNSDFSLCLCRSVALAEQLRGEGVLNVRALPCPAVLCAPETAAAVQPPKGKIGFLLQTTDISCQNSQISFAEEFWRLPENPAQELLCSYIAEARQAASKGKRFRYSYAPEDYFDLYQHYDWIVTTRLHGAISALSAGVPAVLVRAEDNLRVKNAADLFRDVLPSCSSLGQALLMCEAADERAYRTLREKILRFKQAAFRAYQAPLGEFFKRHFPGN